MARKTRILQEDGSHWSNEKRTNRTNGTEGERHKRLIQRPVSSAARVARPARKQGSGVRNLRVFVGMSGGVDSSVTAALLKEQGYDVTGVYMKNWSQDLPSHHCPWKEDYQDAKRVAVQLGIPFKMYDFEKEYRRKVVDYMIAEYKAGRTPNPDIMCNQEIKFKLFLETALEDGADMIATGHYARLKPLAASPGGSTEPTTPRSPRRSAVSESPVLASSTRTYNSLRPSPHTSSSSEPETSGGVGLFTAANKDKDQTYFLYRFQGRTLERVLMPIGEFKTKAEVRAVAKKLGLVTAEKKDSQGICFVGKVGIKDFLGNYVKTKPGKILDRNGRVLGEHEGAIYYTIGQRSGLGIGGGLPYYVIGKDMKKNEVYVTTDLDDKQLWHKELLLADVHWINPGSNPLTGYNETTSLPKINKLSVRMRYRSPLVDCTVEQKDKNTLLVKLSQEVRAVTPGQSAVFYDGDQCLGGGIIT